MPDNGGRQTDSIMTTTVETTTTTTTTTSVVDVDIDIAKKDDGDKKNEENRDEEVINVNAPPGVDPVGVPVPRKERRALVSAQLAKILKGTVAYALGFGWIFWSETNELLQARTLGNIILSIIVSAPAAPVGQYLDSTVVGLMSLLVACCGWALVNLISGTSFVAMGFVAFALNYCFSYLRALGPMFFAIGLIGPLFAFTAIASVVGVTGPNTSNGDAFDMSYLRDTLCSFMVGAAITTACNLFIFPTFAVTDVRNHLSECFRLASSLTRDLANSVRRSSEALEQSVDDTIVSLRAEMALVTRALAQADGEFFLGDMSVTELKDVWVAFGRLSRSLFALASAMKDGRSVLASAEYAAAFNRSHDEAFVCVSEGLTAMLERLASRIAPKHHGHATPSTESTADEAAKIREALMVLQKRFAEVFFSVIRKGDNTAKLTSLMGSVAKEGLTQVNFFNNGIRHVVDEVESLLVRHVDVPRKFGIKFNWRHYQFRSLLAKFSSRHNLPDGVEKEPQGTQSYRISLHKISKFVFSTESIYAFKCSIAILIYQMVLFNATSWYKKYYLTSSFLTFIVAVSPSIGQTNISLFINLSGAALGYSWAYLALTAFGTGTDKFTLECSSWWGCSHPEYLPGVGLTVMAVLWAIPNIHILVNTKMSILGLLSLLSFSTSVVGSWGNRNNPFYDSPYVRWYSLMAGATMAITFAMIFTLIVYPTRASLILRQRIADCCDKIRVLYEITLNTAYGHPQHPSGKEMERFNESIASDLESLEEFMVFSSLEFHVEHKFPTTTYRQLLNGLRTMSDRLAVSRYSLVIDGTGLDGNGVIGAFNKDILRFITRAMRKAKKDVRGSVRTLLYLYATCMIAKRPLPAELPRSVAARNRVSQVFWESLSEIAAEKKADSEAAMKIITSYAAAEDDDDDEMVVDDILSEKTNEGEPLTLASVELLSSDDWLRYYTFVMTMRMLSIEVDGLVPVFRSLFGQLSSGMDLRSYGGAEEAFTIVVS